MDIIEELEWMEETFAKLKEKNDSKSKESDSDYAEGLYKGNEIAFKFAANRVDKLVRRIKNDPHNIN